MKTSTNRYEKQTRVMKMAWKSFKNSSNWESSFTFINSFSDCLEEAWYVENCTQTTSEFTNEHYSLSEVYGILETQDYYYETILETVLENSKTGYKVNIAKNGLKYKSLSEKQAWCMAYEFKNVA